MQLHYHDHEVLRSPRTLTDRLNGFTYMPRRCGVRAPRLPRAYLGHMTVPARGLLLIYLIAPIFLGASGF